MPWPTMSAAPAMSTQPSVTSQGSTGFGTWQGNKGGMSMGGAGGMGASTSGGTGNSSTMSGTWGHDTHANFPGSHPGPSEHDYLFNDRRREGRRQRPS